MPSEYIDLLLCERFGWTPSELREEDAEDIAKILVMWQVEDKIRTVKTRPRGKEQDADLSS